MEASTEMVNGQGDGPAKGLTNCNSENVATILESISSIIDETSESHGPKLDLGDKLSESSDSLNSKPVLPEANGYSIEDEIYLEKDKADYIKKKDKNTIPSTATSSSHIEDSPGISTKSDELSVKRPKLTISKSPELANTSLMFLEETQKLKPEKPPAAIDVTVSSSCATETNNGSLSDVSDQHSNSLNLVSATDQNTASSCESSHIQRGLILEQRNGLSEKANKEIDYMLPEPSGDKVSDSSANPCVQSCLKVDYQDSSNHQKEIIQGNCSDVARDTTGLSSPVTHSTTNLHQTKGLSEDKEEMDLPKPEDDSDSSANVSQPCLKFDDQGSSNHEGDNIQDSCSDTANDNSNLGCPVPPSTSNLQHGHLVTDSISSSPLSVSKENTQPRTNSPSIEQQAKGNNPSNKSNNDSQVVDGSESSNLVTSNEETTQPVQEKTFTLEEPTLDAGNMANPIIESPPEMEVTACVSAVCEISRDVKPKECSFETKSDEKLDEADGVNALNLEGDTSDVCTIKILESSSIVETNDLIENENKRSGNVETGEVSEILDEPEISGNVESNEDITASKLKKSSPRSTEKVSDDSVEEISSSDVHKDLEIINSTQEKGHKLNDTFVSEENENDHVHLPNDSACLGRGSDEKEHVANTQKNTDSVILTDEEPGRKTNFLKATTENGVKVAESKPEDVTPSEQISKTVIENLDLCKAEANAQREDKLSENKEKSDDSHTFTNVKKRSYSTEDASDLEPKRQKLDEAGKESILEKGQNDAMEVIDSDDDVIVADDLSPQQPQAIKEEEKDVKSGDCKEPGDLKTNTDSSLPKAQDLSKIHLSSQVLQAFITARIKAFIKKQKQQQIDKLNQRISMMQSSTSLWKETTKHLERSVKEVTVLNQGVEKRRAHVNACKKLSSRTVGTQVNDGKVKSALTSVQNSSQSQGHGAETFATNSSLGSSVLLNPPIPQQPQQTWKLHPNNGGLPVHWNRLTAPASTTRFTGPSVPSPVRPAPPPSDVVNLIDLTDDDEVLKKSSQSHPPTANAMHNPGSLNNRTNVTTLAGTGKAASLSGNGFIPVTQSRTILAPNVTYHTAGAGPQNHQLTTAVAAGHSQSRPNARLVQLPNHPLAPGHPTNVGFNPLTGIQTSVSNRQAQEPMNPASAKSQWTTKHTLPPSLFIQQQRHPAPLPPAAEVILKSSVRALKLPPKPTLKISRVSQGIVLSWNMPSLMGVEVITSYQLFAYQETDSAPRTSLWKKVGDVRALPLPMACTLTQFLEGNKYHFAVRGVDKYNRTGAFSDPSSIFLGVGSTNTKIALRG